MGDAGKAADTGSANCARSQHVSAGRAAGYSAPAVSSTLLPMVLAFVALTTPLACLLNIWQDEAYSLHTTSRDLPYALHQAVVFEAQAPLYFILLNVWRSVNTSAFFARILSIIFASAAICIVWIIARRRLPLINAAVPTAAFAMNPFVIWAAVEIRLYALGLLLSALLILLFFEGFVEERSSLKFRICYASLGVAALYTQYYLGTILFGAAIVLIRRRAWQNVRAYSFWLAFIVVAALPLALVLPRQLSAFRGYPVSFNPIRAAGIVAENVDFIMPHGWIPTWTHEWNLNAAYVVVTLAAATLIARRKHDKVASQDFGTLSISIISCFFIAIVAAHQQLVVTRQSVALLIPLLLTVFALLGDGEVNVRPIWFVGTCYVVFSVATIAQAYLPPIKSGDWQRVAAYLDFYVKSSDTVAVFNSEIALPLEYYKKANTPILSIPRPLNFSTSFDQRRFAIHNRRELEQTFQQANPAGRVWLVLADQSSRAAAFAGRQILDDFVRSNFRVVLTKQFQGSSVLELVPITSRLNRLGHGMRLKRTRRL